MEIVIYNFHENRQLAYLKMLECQPIIDENLESNGGTLRQDDLLLQRFDWQYLLVDQVDGVPVGFSLIRKSLEDKHNTGYSEYNYLSVIAVKRQVQHMGVGTELLNQTLLISPDTPLVASCHKDNKVSKKFLSNKMMNYEKTRRYYRFLDNKSYKEKYGIKHNCSK